MSKSTKPKRAAIQVEEGNICPICKSRTHQFFLWGEWYRACDVCRNVKRENNPIRKDVEL